jgi:multidrug efflux pump
MLGGRQVTRFKQRRRAVRRDRAGRSGRSQHPRTTSRHLRARQRRRRWFRCPAWSRSGDGQPARAQPLRPAPRGDHHRQPGAGHLAGRGARPRGRRRASILPAGYAVDYNGQTREFKQSSSSSLVTFVLALAFIYLVLAAQFESFVDPLIIMLTVPLSMTGALLALLQWTGGTLNVYSQIGLITLVGPDHQARHPDRRIRQPAARGRPRNLAAVIEAAVAAPAADPDDDRRDGARRGAAGARHRRRCREPPQIGMVIVGGMTLGTVLTLFVVPTAYSYLSGGARHGGRR